MRYSSFYRNFSGFKKANDKTMINDIVVHELAYAIVYRRDDVIDRLNECGITTDSSINAEELTNKVLQNLATNKKLVDGLSLVIAKKNHEEFENFSQETAKDKNKVNVISDVSDELKNLSGTSENELKERVATFDFQSKANPVQGGAGLRVLGILGISVLAICGVVYLKNKIAD